MWEDPIVAEVRSVRERLAAQCGFDVHTVFEDLRQRQTALGGSLVRRRLAPELERAAGPAGGSVALHPGR
jgi:hypothetical protein